MKLESPKNLDTDLCGLSSKFLGLMQLSNTGFISSGFAAT